MTHFASQTDSAHRHVRSEKVWLLKPNENTKCLTERCSWKMFAHLCFSSPESADFQLEHDSREMAQGVHKHN